jgi:hypothetical protein
LGSDVNELQLNSASRPTQTKLNGGNRSIGEAQENANCLSPRRNPKWMLLQPRSTAEVRSLEAISGAKPECHISDRHLKNLGNGR